MAKWKGKCKKRWGNYCWKCGSKNNVTVHHIMPRSIYPSLQDDIDNLRPICRDCHDEYHDIYLRKHLELCNYETFKAWMKNELHDDVVFYHIQAWLLDELGFKPEDWM